MRKQAPYFSGNYRAISAIITERREYVDRLSAITCSHSEDWLSPNARGIEALLSVAGLQNITVCQKIN